MEAIAREVDRKREAGAYAWDMRTNECNHEMDRSGEVPNREDKDQPHPQQMKVYWLNLNRN